MNTDNITARVIEVLEIPSPTYKEKVLADHIRKKYFSAVIKKQHKNKHQKSPASVSGYKIYNQGNSFIAHQLGDNNKPHIALVGHLDVVPKHRSPEVKGDKISGAGASDMKASLGVFLHLIKDHAEFLNSIPYRVSFVFYAKEEQTPLHENGLYELINKYPAWFKSVDLAIVGEPTNNTIQLGCVGSIHARVKIKGKACQSARPWQGENALYKSLPLIKNLAQVKPRPFIIGGVTFYDVFQITELATDPGTTTIPGQVLANINYRFAPRFNKREAIAYFKQFLHQQGLTSREYEIYSFAPMGKIVESKLYTKVTRTLKERGITIQAKQAWTDVAQFGALNVPSFNFGPGLGEKCHADDEYALIKPIHRYTKLLIDLLNGNNLGKSSVATKSIESSKLKKAGIVRKTKSK